MCYALPANDKNLWDAAASSPCCDLAMSHDNTIVLQVCGLLCSRKKLDERRGMQQNCDQSEVFVMHAAARRQTKSSFENSRRHQTLPSTFTFGYPLAHFMSKRTLFEGTMSDLLSPFPVSKFPTPAPPSPESGLEKHKFSHCNRCLEVSFLPSISN